MTSQKLSFVSSGAPAANNATKTLKNRYGNNEVEDADVVVVLGGDGKMLQTLHQVMSQNIPVYGMHFGSVGFLMNDFDDQDLPARIAKAQTTTIHPLSMVAKDVHGKKYEALAINEVSMFRASFQAAKIEIRVDGHTRIEELICDGVLLSTPAGSTAYNLSAHGPILPIDSPLLALTPISPFRPRRWRGAILPNKAKVVFAIHECEKRPVSVVADNRQFKDIIEVSVQEDRSNAVTLLFDPGHSLEERVLNEQFRY